MGKYTIDRDNYLKTEIRNAVEALALNALPFEVLLDTWVATVDNTATGKTLAALKGSALDGGLKEIAFILHDAADDVRWNNGTASASTSKIPDPGLSLPIAVDLAETIKLFCTAGASVTIIEVG